MSNYIILDKYAIVEIEHAYMSGLCESKYKKKYAKLIDDYIASCEDVWEEFHKTRGVKSDSFEEKITVKLPSVEGFVIWLEEVHGIRIVRKTIYNWDNNKDYPEFSAALDKLRTVQMQRLVEGGLSGHYNHVITKLMLSSNHGMKERIDNTTNDKDINAFSDEQADRVAERLARGKAGTGDTSS